MLLCFSVQIRQKRGGSDIAQPADLPTSSICVSPCFNSVTVLNICSFRQECSCAVASFSKTQQGLLHSSFSQNTLLASQKNVLFKCSLSLARAFRSYQNLFWRH